MLDLHGTFYAQSIRALLEGCLDIRPALTHTVCDRAGEDEMKTTDEERRLERRRKLDRLKERSTLEVGPVVWNREELYTDRTPPRFRHPDPDRSEKKE
jgi:hypothetical protein